MLKFERILTTARSARSRASWSSFPQAMKNTLGEKLWVKGIISSHLGVPGSKILFTEHHQSHAAAAFLTAAGADAPPSSRPTASASGRRSRSASGEKKDDGKAYDQAPARAPLPALARDALLDVHRVPRLRGERGRVQGDGARLVRKARVRRRGAQGHPPGRDGAPSRSISTTSTSTRPRSARTRRSSSSSSAPPRAPHQPLDPTTPEGARFADIAASVQRVLEDTLVEITKALHEETGGRTSASAAASRSTASRTRASCASRASSESSSRRRRATRGARSARRSTPTASTSATRTARSPITRTGVPSVDAGGARAHRARGRPADRDRRRRGRGPRPHRRRCWRATRSSAGWTARAEFGPRALGNRSILAAPHSRGDEGPAEHGDQVPRGVPPLRARGADRGRRARTSSSRRAARVSARSCPASSRCARSGAKSSPRSPTSTAPRACRRSSARRRRASTRSSSATGRGRGMPDPPEHVVQPRGRADRHPRRRGVLDVPPLRHRRPRRGKPHRLEEAGARRASHRRRARRGARAR